MSLCSNSNKKNKVCPKIVPDGWSAMAIACGSQLDHNSGIVHYSRVTADHGRGIVKVCAKIVRDQTFMMPRPWSAVTIPEGVVIYSRRRWP